MPKPKDTPEELTEQMTDLTNPLSPNEVKAYQANILYRLKRARWHIDEVMKHYPTESMGSALDRLRRAQSLVAEISKDGY
jgi:hypothetical protein